MVTVPEPHYDPRFSTKAALNRTVVTGWVQARAGDVLDEWFAKGFPHKRLATEAMEAAVSEGWVEGAQTIWDCGWVAKGPLLRAAWSKQSRFRRQLRPAQVPDTPIEAWLIEKTWGPTDGVDKEWARGQVAARITALLYAERNPMAWDRYLTLGVSLASNAGHDLLNRLLMRRFPRYMSERDLVVAGEARQQLDRQIDQLLALPEADRAPVNGNDIVDLLHGTVDPRWDEATHAAAWSVLQRRLEGGRPTMDASELGMTLCQVALVGRLNDLPQERLDLIRDRLLAWGAPASFTITAEEMAYGGRFYGVMHNQGRIAVQGGHRPWSQANHVTPITAAAPTVHVGDHWFATRHPDRRCWEREAVEPLTDAQKQDYRARFEALVEAAELVAEARRPKGRRTSARTQRS